MTTELRSSVAYRNGKTLGVAFTLIRIGPSVAYFPAVSLAYQENIVANFGATPLQFPVDGIVFVRTKLVLCFN